MPWWLGRILLDGTSVCTSARYVRLFADRPRRALNVEMTVTGLENEDGMLEWPGLHFFELFGSAHRSWMRPEPELLRSAAIRRQRLLRRDIPH